MKITFCGAAETVTGSCHLVETDGLKILFDCGMFQGGRDIERRNWDPFPFDPGSIDLVLLSHAHLDHVGLIPRLVREGFSGEIVATEPTTAIAKLILADSAHIQVEEASYRTRKARRRGGDPVEPLYDMGDVLDSLNAFRRTAEYGVPVPLGKGVEAIYHDAGHILGSAFIELRTPGRTILYSGDLGNRDQPIVRDPADPPKADVVLIESTYGDRSHRAIEDSVDELAEAIRVTTGKGGNLMIPSFALERTQEILYELFSLWRAGKLPSSCSIFLDSPLAIATTRVFARHPGFFDTEGRAIFSGKPNPFNFPPLRYSQTTEDSKRINASGGGNIIIAGSGMCSGGRNIHHLRHNLWDPNAGIIFVGDQANGTLGRRIVDGAGSVNVYGEEVSVRARVWTVNGFSSHADQPILLEWLAKASAEHVFLVHGETRSLEGLGKKVDEVHGMTPVIPAYGETITL